MNRNNLFWLALILFSMSSFSLFAQFAGGSGTEQDPYQVATAQHLNNVRNYSSSHFIQTADINLGIAPWNQGSGWTPFQMNGVYNGDGHVIDHLYIYSLGSSYLGLFSTCVSSASVMNLGITNVYITGGGDYTGGLVGRNYGTISRCFSSGSIRGGYATGGLAGETYGGSISNCYSTVSITGGTRIGGLVGSALHGFIGNCYSTGSVPVGTRTGGLMGWNYLVNISNSYWDMESSGHPGSAGGEGRSTSEMVYPHATNTYIGWDWVIWKTDLEHEVNEGYPYFRNLEEMPTQAPEPAVAVYPLHQAVSILPSLPLEWEAAGISPSNNEFPTGFRLWLGTDNPPTNICAGLDLSYNFSYDPNPDFELNTTYFWQIVPYNAIGEAQNCPVWTFSTYNPSFAIINPNGGELWQSGTTQTIRWTQNAIPQLRLSISFDNGNNWMEISPVEDGRSYFHYQVPVLTSPLCLIKLHSLLDGSQLDVSDSPFSISSSISQPKVILNYLSEAGIHLSVGTAVNLAWTRQNVGAVALDFSSDDGQTWMEFASGLETNSYLWTVPEHPSLECRVRVRSDANPYVLDISDNAFSIGKIQILSPNGGEIFTADHSNTFFYPVTWTAPGVTLVNIEYSSNGGSTWISLQQQWDADNGLYYWYPPGTPTTNGLIRVYSSDNSVIYDVSDAPFSIRNPIKLLNANGGGFITNSNLFNIRWKMQDISPTAMIYWEYSPDDNNWTRINTSAVAVSTESMYWLVNTGLDDSVWLRAVEQGTDRIVGKSEASFQVTDRMLMLYEPNGGEDYIAQTTQTISWDHSGLTNLSIYFSADDGANWSQIVANVPASNLSYSWIVPETPSVHCRIRLQDQSYTYMNLVSDLTFTISPQQVIAPSVDFTADVLAGDIPLSVQFTEDVNPGVGNIASRLWDFGDGNTSDQENPLHTYTVAGTYTVSLTVTNDFEGTTTKTKTDYITALPNTPRIELLSVSSLNYGVVYLGDTSPAQIIEVKNIGTAPMIISSVSYYLANSQFALSGTELPITVPVNETTQLNVVFAPISSGAVSDSIYIHSDASNIPNLAVKLSAVGEYVPPAAVDGLVVSVIGNDAHLTWQPVTTTIYGTPIEPDGYIVLYNETPYEDEHFYYFHSFVTGTSFVHPFVAQYRTEMFYRIVAVKNYREEAVAYLTSLNGSRDRFTWGEIKEKLNTLKQRQ